MIALDVCVVRMDACDGTECKKETLELSENHDRNFSKCGQILAVSFDGGDEADFETNPRSHSF